VTTQEALVAPEAAAAKAAAVTAAKAAVSKAAAAKATVAKAAAAKATVAKAAVAKAVATPCRRGDVHWADHSRYRRRRGGISCRCGTEKHCAGHRACAECAGGDAAGRRE
jgi:hypothetical protein